MLHARSKRLVVAFASCLLCATPLATIAYALDDGAVTEESQAIEAAPEVESDTTEAEDTVVLADPAADASTAAQADLSKNPIVLKQQEESTKLTISLAQDQIAALEQNAVETVTIDVYMKYNNVRYKEQKLSYTVDELKEGQTVDLGVWGKFYADIALVSKNKTLKSFSETFGIIASSYNVAPLTATLPGAYFALSMFDTGAGNPISGFGTDGVLHDANGATIPTVLFLMRPGMYSWDNLPEGSYLLPYGDPTTLTTQQKDYAAEQKLYFTYNKNMQAYVKDLIEVSPNSHFNFFFGDHFVGEVFEYVYANNLAEDKYSVYFASDGTMSYSSMHSTFTGDAKTNEQKLNSMVEQWKKAIANSRKQGKNTGEVPYGDPGYIPAATLADKNIHWMVARKALLYANNTKPSTSFDTTYIEKNANIIQFNMGTMFKGINERQAQDGLKKLFNLGESFFGDTQGKPIMILLGSTVNGAEVARPFEPFARAIKAIYGNDYYYVYKGHPATPTKLYPEKQQQLDVLGITDVESSVPAELILFFYPDVKLAGYDSSTYASAGSADQLQIIYGVRKAQAAENTNKNYLKNFSGFFNLIDKNDPDYGSYVDGGYGSYLIEFSDAYLAAHNNEFDFAMYNNTKDNLTYFKDGAAVSSTNGVSGAVDVNVENGVYNIVSTKGLSVDMAGFSTANGKEPLLWNFSDNPNQRWYIKRESDGYYTIKNVYSNKYLDVYGANAYSGAKVIQWQKTGGDNQKWKIQQNGKDSVRIVSKLGNYSLDIQYNNQKAGGKLELWDNNYSGAQRFSLQKIERASLAEFSPVTLATGMNNMSKLGIDVPGASRTPGANLILYPLRGAKNQSFIFSYNHETGYYTIISVNSWLALDVAGADFRPGAKVIQWTPNGGFNQQWSIIPSNRGDGSFMLKSAVGNCVVDAFGAQAKSMTPLILWDKTGNPNQIWKPTLNSSLMQ